MTLIDSNIILLKKKIILTSSLLKEFFLLYGIGWHKSLMIAKCLGFFDLNKKKNFKMISEKKLVIINFLLKENLKLETHLQLYKKGTRLKYMTFFNFKRLRTTYGLPVRGQRTQTNHRTARFLKNK